MPFHARTSPWSLRSARELAKRGCLLLLRGVDYVPFSEKSVDFLTLSQCLSLGAPDALDQAVALGQAVHGIVALAHRSHEAAEGVDVVLAGNGAAVLVNLGDRNLDGTVVLGLDDAVGGAALAGDVAGREKFQYFTPFRDGVGEIAYRSTISPRSFSILTVLGGLFWRWAGEVRSVG
ncbi:hypothetical protein HJFPF1_01699 [Paramyrothecium foliicola]|nr:hypothetical protein HJFPF1_01699 [Paramyrothecium foliicola]